MNERTTRAIEGPIGRVSFLPVIDNSSDDLNKNSEKEVDVNFCSTAIQRSETSVDEKRSILL